MAAKSAGVWARPRVVSALPETNTCAVVGAPGGTRPRYPAVQALSSVIIVVDGKRIGNLNMGQLADYVAMVGLAQIRQGADTGSAPTILGLFRKTDRPPPQGLSPWDESFLHGLYTTDQTTVIQVSTIKAGMFEQIGRQRALSLPP